MTNTDKQSTVFRDMAVFEYVAGTQTESAKADFEQQLSMDQGLADELKFERLLRILSKEEKSEYSGSASAFEQLLNKIDENHAVETQHNQVEQVSWFTKFNGNMVSIAASVLFATVITTVLLKDLLEPKFVTLTTPPQATYADFSDLVSEHRLAKIVLTSSISTNEIRALLADYQLEPISSTIEQQTLFVKSAKIIDEQTLSKLQNDARIEKANRVEFKSVE